MLVLRRFFYALLLSVIINSNCLPAFAIKPDIELYITDHKTLAKVLSVIYGIPTSFILGVAIVESSAGTGDIARVFHNHFGIVGHNQFITKNGSKSRYKQYYNEIGSYIDFCRYVSKKRCYHKLKYKNNPSLWIHAFSQLGYSEEPETWEEKILHTIAVNHLK